MKRFTPLTLFIIAIVGGMDGRANTPATEWTADFENQSELSPEDWWIEGTGSATITDGAVHLQETPDGVGVVLWTQQDWPSDLRLSFDVSFSNNRGIGVIFLAGRGSDGSDLAETREARTGAYDEYIRGEVDSYSLSLHRFWPDGRNNPGSNLRRNSGFHLLDQALPDPCMEAGRVYRIEIIKEGPALTVRVDGKQTHHAADNGEFGAPHKAGKIGFRLRGDASCVMRIDNIRVESP